MARRASHVLGVDFGTTSVKVVELRLRGQDVELVRGPVIKPCPEGAVDGGQVLDASLAAEALQEALGELHPTTRQAVVGVAGDPAVVVRIAELPRTENRKEFEENVRYEISRHTQFELKDLVYDHAVLPEAEGAQAERVEVLLAAAHIDVVETTLQAVKRAKLRPVAVDVQPLALARAAISTVGRERAEQTTIGLFHVGATSSLIIIIRQGVLKFVRLLPQGSASFTDAIAGAGIDREQAECIKRAWADLRPLVGVEVEPAGETIFEMSDQTSGLGPEAEEPTELEVEAEVGGGEAPATEEEEKAPAAPEEERAEPELTEEQQRVIEALAERLEQPAAELANEVRRSVEFYRRQHRNEPVDQILLSGGGSLLKGFAEFMSAELEIPCAPCRPFATLAIREGDEALRRYAADVGPVAAIAAGLALYDMV